MNREPVELQSCVAYTMQPCNSDINKCNTSSNQNATTSLKALAQKVLERSNRHNLTETIQANACNFEGPTGSLKLDNEIVIEINSVIRNVDIRRLIARIASFYNYTQGDIDEVATAALCDPIGVAKALYEQAIDIDLLETQSISWHEVPAELLKQINRLCEIRQYSVWEKEKMIQSTHTMSFAQMLREIKVFSQMIDGSNS